MDYKEKLKLAEDLYNRVRLLSSGEAIETATTLEQIFPELCESEDEKIRKAIIEFLNKCGNGYFEQPLKKEIKEWITWLEKQKEQIVGNDYDRGFRDGVSAKKYNNLNKQEWSEEDNRHRKRIIERLEGIRKFKENNQDIASVVYSEILWLKNLRPNHWKPSEEQMEIIKMILTNEAMDDNVHSILESLYNDLQKL